MKRKDWTGRSMSQEKIKTSDSKKISAFLDGELSARDERSVRRHMDEGSEVFRRELESFRGVRQEVRQWLHEQKLDASGSVRECSVWDAIEHRLDEKEEKSFFGESVRRLVSEGQRRLGQILEETLRRPQLASGMVAAAALLVTGALYLEVGKEGVSEPAQILAHRTVAASDESVPNQGIGSPGAQEGETEPVYVFVPSRRSDTGVPQRTVSGRDKDAMYVTLRSRPQATQHRLQHKVPLHLFSQAPKTNTPVRGGLRTDDFDIDWIETDRPFKIVPATGRNAPPVIWVNRKTH